MCFVFCRLYLFSSQHRVQSARLSFQSFELGPPPTPSPPQGMLLLPLRVQGGETHSLAGEGVGVPIPTKGQTLLFSKIPLRPQPPPQCLGPTCHPSTLREHCIAGAGLPIHPYDRRGFVGPKKKTIVGLLGYLILSGIDIMHLRKIKLVDVTWIRGANNEHVQWVRTMLASEEDLTSCPLTLCVLDVRPCKRIFCIGFE